MRLMTPIGFFSIVQKPADAKAGTLTVRARAREDLDALRAGYLPGLGPVAESHSNDYRFRAVAARADVATALQALVHALDYDNFKDAVAAQQGTARVGVYRAVWSALRKVGPPVQKAKKAATGVFHPRHNDGGQPEPIHVPSVPTALTTWHDASTLARVVPDGPMPPMVGTLPIGTWQGAPTTDEGWEALVADTTVTEPAFPTKPGYKRSAGVVIREPDGRCWLVAPTNGFAGYRATFPKGTITGGMSAQATALKEAFEESGLQVRLLKHLIDVQRTMSIGRYYLAERLGGNPADMGWESQAVLLVPHDQLLAQLNSKHDHSIVARLGAG